MSLRRDRFTIGLVAAATMVGLSQTWEAPVSWDSAGEPSLVERYERVRPALQGVETVFLLMVPTAPEQLEALPPSERRAVESRQRDVGQRFKLQYAAAPTVAEAVRTIGQLDRQATSTDRFTLVWDSSFALSLATVQERLQKIADRTSRSLHTVQVEPGLAVLFLE